MLLFLLATVINERALLNTEGKTFAWSFHTFFQGCSVPVITNRHPTNESSEKKHNVWTAEETVLRLFEIVSEP